MILCRPALHRLPHNMSMHTWAFLPGIVKRLENAIDFLFVQFAVDFWKPQVKAYKQRALYLVDRKAHKVVARRKPAQVSFGAEPFVVAVDNLAVGTYQIQAIMRLIQIGPPPKVSVGGLPSNVSVGGQSVRTAKRDPESEFAGQCHDFLRFLPEQLPLISVKGWKIGADVAAQSALRKMNNISVRLTCLAQEFTDLPSIPPDVPSNRELTRSNF